MSAVDLLSVLCGVLALSCAAALAVLAGRVLRAVQALNAATELFLAEAVPAVQELRSEAQRASSEVDRIDDLLEVAGAIGDRVDSATEATFRALTSPVIKSVALASGTRRAARRLRSKGDATNSMVGTGAGRGAP
ncbi:unannotated protein [freshwater metagenome]|uniref:Unannotated protein n=1 Tax=freshwater metagenome TaxID=449393 RepID=A0A6J6SRL0_9ZZZZ|nr:hypothetical protein [Actinomycetota bacterium]MSY78789.1 hypothetical protein [Actinomycetota bacterium]MTA64759.1 hypothetical protein [Actinomycetota bacterium]